MSDFDRKAQSAQRLLEDRTLREALEDIENEFMGRWRASSAADLELREDAWRAIRAVDLVRARLKTYVKRGEFEKTKLAKLQKSKVSV